MQEVDFLILGAGSAGAVLGARLSEDPSCHVVLVDAGSDFAANGLPSPAKDVGMRTVFHSEYFRPPIVLEHPVRPGSNETRKGTTLTPQVVGGGSFVNGMQAARGLSRDYDQWAAFGITGWSSEDLMPYFAKVESDIDFPDGNHGTEGPVTISRVPAARWSPLTKAVLDAFSRQSVPEIADLNDGTSTVGYGPVPLSAGPQGRMSTANAYLTPEVRRRSNLTIIPNMQAKRILFDGKRAVGAFCEGPNGPVILTSLNVIVSCGALQSPALLQRSGVGPAPLLREAGIEVVANRPGVGMNFIYHAILSVNVHLKRAGWVQGPLRDPCPTVVRYSSGEPGFPDADVYLYVWERATPSLPNDWLSRQLANLMLQLNYCRTAGTVTIRPEDPSGDPQILSRLLDDERDRKRMVSATRNILQLAAERPLAPLVRKSLFIKPSRFAAMIMEESWRGWVLNRLAALALAGPSTVADAALRHFAVSFDDLSEDELDTFLRMNTGITHPAGTCRLGNSNDRLAVVDERARVIGVEGLWTADASIIPTLSIGGPNLPTMAIAEKVADMIKQDVGDTRALA